MTKLEELKNLCHKISQERLAKRLKEKIGNPKEMRRKNSEAFRKNTSGISSFVIDKNNEKLDKLLNELEGADAEKFSKIKEEYYNMYETYYGKEQRKINEEVFAATIEEVIAEVTKEKNCPELELPLLKIALKRALKAIKLEYRFEPFGSGFAG